MNDPVRLPSGVRDLADAICGCATTENTWVPVIAELERLDRREFKEEDDLATALVDHLGLSEHGTSSRGGWLTDAGREALAFLRLHGPEWREAGEFVDDNNVHYGEL